MATKERRRHSKENRQSRSSRSKQDSDIVSALDEIEESRPEPFWRKLNMFFLFPFQKEPLMYMLAFSVGSLIFIPISYLGLLGIILLPVATIGLMYVLCRYFLRIITYASQGILRTSDYQFGEDDGLAMLPWMLWGANVIFSFCIGPVFYLTGPGGLFLYAVLLLLYPAIVMVLVKTGSFSQTLNPLAAIEVIRAIGWPYALLLVFLFLFNISSGVAMQLAMPVAARTGGLLILLPTFTLITTYFIIAMASMIGYTMHQYHKELDIEQAEGIEEGAQGGDFSNDPFLAANKRADARVAKLIAAGEIEEALNFAYEEHRQDPEDLHANKRYHNTLLLANAEKDGLFEHAKHYIHVLVQASALSDALAVYKTCAQKDKNFRPASGASALAIAQYAWRGADERSAINLLSGFAKFYPSSESLLPKVYELSIRILVQGFNRRDKAMPLFKYLVQNHPQSEHTKEARWIIQQSATS